jgi:hypothetical protein
MSPTTAVYVRDVASQLAPNATQRTTLIVAGCYILIIAILWCVALLEQFRSTPAHAFASRHVPYLNKISQYCIPMQFLHSY